MRFVLIRGKRWPVLVSWTNWEVWGLFRAGLTAVLLVRSISTLVSVITFLIFLDTFPPVLALELRQLESCSLYLLLYHNYTARPSLPHRTPWSCCSHPHRSYPCSQSTRRRHSPGVSRGCPRCPSGRRASDTRGLSRASGGNLKRNFMEELCQLFVRVKQADTHCNSVHQTGRDSRRPCHTASEERCSKFY